MAKKNRNYNIPIIKVTLSSETFAALSVGPFSYGIWHPYGTHQSRLTSSKKDAESAELIVSSEARGKTEFLTLTFKDANEVKDVTLKEVRIKLTDLAAMSKAIRDPLTTARKGVAEGTYTPKDAEWTKTSDSPVNIDAIRRRVDKASNEIFRNKLGNVGTFSDDFYTAMADFAFESRENDIALHPEADRDYAAMVIRINMQHHRR